MSEIRAPVDKELVKKDYLKGMKYKDLAEKYGVTLNTVKSWKQRYSWDRKSVHTKEEVCTPKKRGAPKGNKNSVGHAPSVPKRNKNAETHGFFSKYLPEETLELVKEIEQKDKLDILWENITIQYAAIIRAQRIMNVESKDEMIKEIKKEEHSSFEGGFTDKTEWEFQFAWDRHATFLNAQSRAMGELRSMIKQYEELVNSGLSTEEQRLRIEKIKADIEKVKDPDKDKPIEIIIKRKGEEK
jgi:uncharacterized protein YjcR